MNRTRQLLHISLVLGTVILAGCTTPFAAQPPSEPEPVVQPAPAPTPVATPAESQLALTEGIEMYNQGNFDKAIARLGDRAIASGPSADRIRAHKYLAFSYCVSERAALCRQHFEAAFKLDPAFDLGPGEHGHPLWGPEFSRAKKSKK